VPAVKGWPVATRGGTLGPGRTGLPTGNSEEAVFVAVQALFYCILIPVIFKGDIGIR